MPWQKHLNGSQFIDQPLRSPLTQFYFGKRQGMWPGVKTLDIALYLWSVVRFGRCISIMNLMNSIIKFGFAYQWLNVGNKTKRPQNTAFF